jgi:hypothetical protein
MAIDGLVRRDEQLRRTKNAVGVSTVCAQKNYVKVAKIEIRILSVVLFITYHLDT